MTVWRAIPGFEGLYEASEDGRVRSLGRWCDTAHGGLAFRKGRQLVPVRKTNGYLAVSLTKGLRKYQVGVHRLVASAFLGAIPKGRCVCHWDGDRENNRVSNLRIATARQNMVDRERHGRTRRGARHGMSKLTERQVRHVRSSTKTNKVLAAELGVTIAHVHSIRSGRTWRHVS